jgi:rRNA maturation RNase YbeY
MALLLWLTVATLLSSFTVAAMSVRYLTRRLTARMSASSKLPQVASELQAKLRASSSSSSSSSAPASSSSPLSTAELLALGRDTTSFKNSQTLAMKKKYPIHAAAVKEQVAWIKLFLGVSDFQVDVWFCSDAKMMQLNGEWRNKRKSTDILSFPANDFTAPLVFADDPAMAFEKHLGDLVVSPAYVMRQCARAAKDVAEGLLDDDEDAGVSKAMSTVFTLDERVPLLLVHGMLHLVGYVRPFFPSIPPLLFFYVPDA